MTFTSTTIRELRALGLEQEVFDKVLDIFERAHISKTKKKGGAEDRAKRGTRLAEDWELPADWRELAIGLGLRPNEVNREAMKIKNWSRSSANGIKLDWKSTWRNWCIATLERAGRPVLSPEPNGNGGAAAMGPETFNDKTWQAIARRYKNSGQWNPEWGPPPGRMDCLMPENYL